jgi:protein-S-isoprenylcysteine O-methyltransferase Ste14
VAGAGRGGLDLPLSSESERDPESLAGWSAKARARHRLESARSACTVASERMGSSLQRDQPVADKLLLIALLFLMFAWLVLMGLDAKRFAWSSVPALVQVLGVLIMLWSIWFCYRTMREISFAAPVIKLQQDRGQRVISTGPYAFVCHPMYFGAGFYFIGTALLLRLPSEPRPC